MDGRGPRRGYTTRPGFSGAGPGVATPRVPASLARAPAWLCHASRLLWRGPRRGCATRPAYTFTFTFTLLAPAQGCIL